MLTPLDIQNKEFKRSMRGYSMEEVDQFLDQLVQDYEALYLENQMLKEKLDASEAAKTRYQDMEKLIKDTILMAQKNAEELKRNARQEAEVILEEARVRAEKIIAEAGEKAARTVDEAREKARFRTNEADERVRSILEEYRFLEKQTRLFRVKFRAFLEAQLSLLEGQEEEAREIMLDAGLGMAQTAASLQDDFTPARDHDTKTGEDTAGGEDESPDGDDREQPAPRAG